MGYQLGALWKENINPAEVMNAGAIWRGGVTGGRKRGGGEANPQSYVLREEEKTNIWLSAVGRCLLNDYATGYKHSMLTIIEVPRLAKCDDFFLTPHPSLSLSFFPMCVCACYWVCMDVSICVCVCLCVHACVCFISLIEAWGLCCSQSLSHIFKVSKWHDSTPAVLTVTCGFIKACIWNSGKTASRSRQIKQWLHKEPV